MEASAADLKFCTVGNGLKCTEPYIGFACESERENVHAMCVSLSLRTQINAYSEIPKAADGIADSSVVAERDSVSLRSTVKNKVLT